MAFRHMPAAERFRAYVTVLLSGAVLTVPAGAQAFPVTEWGPQIMSRVQWNVIRDSTAARRSGAPVMGADTGAVVAPTFTPSIERRRANTARRVAGLRTFDPDGAAELERVTAERDTIAAFAARVGQARVNAYSVSDVFAVWVSLLWQELHPAASAPPAMLAVRSQVDRALRDIPAFARATEAEKQEFAEALILHLIANADRLRRARGDAAAQARVAALVQKAGAELRVDFEHMTLTSQGLMPSDMVKP